MGMMHELKDLLGAMRVEEERTSTATPNQWGEQWWHRGPYPAGMREQPFGPSLSGPSGEKSSAYTVKPPVSQRLDPRFVEASQDGRARNVTLSYPDVDWQGVKETAGWAGLQWQALLWTEVVVAEEASGCTLAASIQDALEFTVVKVHASRDDNRASIDGSDGAGQHPDPAQDLDEAEWFTADFYSYDADRSKPSVPHLLALDPGKYWLVVKPLYEVRVFGGFPADGVPSVKVTIDLEFLEERSIVTPWVQPEPPLTEVPDVVAGRLAGQVVSIGLTNASRMQMWTVEAVTQETGDDLQQLGPILLKNSVLPPLSTSRIGLQIDDNIDIPLTQSTIVFTLTLRSTTGDMRTTVRAELPLHHLPVPHPSSMPYSFKHTYITSYNSTVVSAYILPPVHYKSDSTPRPVIVALHGAGVDVDQSPFWRTALPRQRDSWIVLPTGLTPWGLDWQQQSHSSWLDLVSNRRFTWPILRHARPEVSLYDPFITNAPSVVLIGHSNGGQGAWYGLVHGSDQFIGGIVAAGYIKLEEYVSFGWRDLRHTADPTLTAVLDSSRTVFANDVHASNLVGLPLLIKYGQRDDNVPPWHSRAMKALLDQWSDRSDIARKDWPRLVEVPGRGHWWDCILQEDDVQGHLSDLLDRTKTPQAPSRFTLTTVVPSVTQGRFGWHIRETDVPGRIARLDVQYVPRQDGAQTAKVQVSTINVRTFTVGAVASGIDDDDDECDDWTSVAAITIDGHLIVLSQDSTECTVHCNEQGMWELMSADIAEPRLLSPITLLLDRGPAFLIVLPSKALNASRQRRFASVARRWAQSLMLYTSLSATPVPDDSVSTDELQSHSCIFLGGPEENEALQRVAEQSRSTDGKRAWSIDFIQHLGAGQFSVRGRPFGDADTGLLYSIPHPASTPAHPHRAVVLTGTDDRGIERAARLLPIRTGTPVPEWIVIGRDADRFGGAGVLGVGWYDGDWGYSEAMSYLT